MSYDKTLVSRSKKKSKLPLFLGCAGIAVLLLAVLLAGVFYFLTHPAGQSIISIRSPLEGDRLVAGEPEYVSAYARDEDRVTRIELWVDGELVAVEESQNPNGVHAFPLLTTWYPTEGAHTLIVRAFDRRGDSFQATTTVFAAAIADRDADGIADADDLCPDAAGSLPAEGCPDRDFDGIADLSDSCPDDAGLPPDGCPAPSESDRDGDGMLDSADACPDVVGSPLADGCPDADGDGTPDSADACPAEPGTGMDGCPEPGGGIPPDPAPDAGGELPMPRPGDDPPVPGDDEAPEDGGIAEVFPLPADPAQTQLEIEAYYLYVRDVYDELWCYVRLDDGDPRRYDITPEEGQLVNQYWNIAEEFSGENSVTILHPENEPLAISVNCLGANEGEEPHEIEGLSASHAPEEWDGRAQDLSIADENIINVRYHICSPSCDETALVTPRLAPVTFGPTGNGPYLLRWQWRGDESQIDGFLVKRFHGDYDTENIWVLNPGARSLNLADHMPACGESIEFYVVAIRNTEDGYIYSTHSNREAWAADPCTYTASVTFTNIDVHNAPADEQGLHRPGPIYGEFWVSNGTTVEALEFNACWCYFGPGATFWGWCEGLELEQASYTPRSIFDWIHTAQASCIGDGCNSNAFYAPSSSSLHIPFEDGDDLTIGGRIMDCDARNANDVLFEGQGAIQITVDDLDYLTQPLEFGLLGEHVNLSSFIRLGH